MTCSKIWLLNQLQSTSTSYRAGWWGIGIEFVRSTLLLYAWFRQSTFLVEVQPRRLLITAQVFVVQCEGFQGNQNTARPEKQQRTCTVTWEAHSFSYYSGIGTGRSRLEKVAVTLMGLNDDCIICSIFVKLCLVLFACGSAAACRKKANTPTTSIPPDPPRIVDECLLLFPDPTL